MALMATPSNAAAAHYYLRILSRVSQKNQVRLDPGIKRTLCKKCSMILIMGVTATRRHTGHKRKHTVLTCLECGLNKRFRTDNTKHQLWSTQREAWNKLPYGIIQDSSTSNLTENHAAPP